MKIGMLWYDNDPKAEPVEKIRKAVAYYRHKYGQEPNTAFVHAPAGASMGEIPPVDGVTIKQSPYVAHNHIWLGVEE